jgi:hypothetical protein
MDYYWDDFISKNKKNIPYWSIQKILEKFYDYLDKQGKLNHSNVIAEERRGE